MTKKYSDLVDPDEGQISALIYADEDIYDQEMRSIFGTSWLFLAHESMIPKKGDYLTTTMGDDPVVVVRQSSGEFVAFMNQCRHRGMRLCRSDEGNAKAFTCSYHGWVYDLSGKLVQVPHEEDGYLGALNKEKLGAQRVPRVTNYKGFIFGTWSEEGPTFEEYLGDMAWYFDSFADRWQHNEVLGAPNRWIIDCNWKFPAEQFATDVYHAETSHISALIAQGGDWVNADTRGLQFSSPGGHGTGFYLDDAPDMTDYGPVASEYRAAIRQTEIERLGETRAVHVRGHNTIFPNFSFLVGTNTFRIWQPRGPHSIEVMTWTLGDADAPAEVKDAMRRNALRTFSAGGIFEAEDGENWSEIQGVLKGSRAGRSSFNFTMGRGAAGHHDDFPGRIGNIYSEEAGRSFYRRWLELMEKGD
ncbi:aromatic ring-hydroxylating dioxygenase subunit alpha [Arthrobacter globiformis]|uniref:aromatic ring-hydroxylating oxygenase subunit alpha n=1 Tax=Arthrobacter globiformis TaxID=1665 RepID=UPI00397E38EF